MSENTTIKCPHCNSSINIEDALYMQLKSKFDLNMQAERAKYKKAMEDLSLQQESIKKQEVAFNLKLQEAVNEKLSKERVSMKTNLTKELKEAILNENALQIKQLEEELDDKSKQVQELNASKATIAKLQREKSEIESKIQADTAIEMNRLLLIEKEKLQKAAQEANELKLRVKDEQLEQIKKQLDDAKRKAEQGSMQIQGEVQERSIEEFLELHFKYDTVQEISKGAFGADCIQIINTLDFQNCGKICYESKNTKAFGGEWISKLKKDMLDVGADVGVLVTSIYPKGMDRMGFYDGIWICSYDEFKGSAALLRESIIGVHKVVLSQENKVDKTNLLYNYFTSNEFMMQFEAIVGGFLALQDELNKQKRSMNASFKRQQKSIDMVLSNTTNMYGTIKAIAGNAIANIKVLELEYDEESASDDE